MSSLLENTMLGLFAIAAFIWLLQIRRAETSFHKRDKIRAVSFSVAFLLCTLFMGIDGNAVGALISLAGFVISELAAAIVFYENFKDVEVPYE